MNRIVTRSVNCIGISSASHPAQRPKQHRFLILALILIVVMPGLVAFAPPPQPVYNVELAASVGYEGFYRRGQWTPVRVTVSNDGDDLNGYVRVRTGELGGFEETTYRTPIDLPQGARKQVFLYMSFENFASTVQVEIVDADGDIVARVSDRLRLVDRGDILAAVITESTYGAVDLTIVTPGAGRAYQVNWRIEDIPTLSDALAGLDVIMFHDVDTGALRAEQAAALRQWIMGGGHLIVAGGDTWQRTTAGFSGLLPVTLERTVTVDSVEVFADFLDRVPRNIDEGMTVTATSPHASARVLVDLNGVPLLVRGILGGGVVDFLAVDPNAEPLRSWSDTRYLWYTLLATTGQQPSWSRGLSNWSVAREATLTTFNTVLPTFFQLCGFLIMYIVLIGPVNYLALKQINRREWAWLTIPALIVVFSVLAYQVGFNLRGSLPTVNRLTVVRVWADGEESEVSALIGVQSPRRSLYDVAVDRGFTLRTLPEEGVGLNVPVIITEGTRYLAEDIPIDAGTIASFVASGSVPAPQLESSVVWQLDEAGPPHLQGRITNTTTKTFEDVVLLIKGEARALGTLDPGETRDFDIAIGPQEPGPLTLGNATRSASPFGYGFGYSTRPRGCFNYSGLPLTFVDVMGGEEFKCGANVSDREQEVRRRYRLLGALIADQDLSGGRGDGVYVFAWTHEMLVNVELIGRPHADEDTTLYIFELPVQTEALAEVIEVPAALTTWTVTDKRNPDTVEDVTPTGPGFQIGPNSQAAFQFMPLPAMQLAEVTELDLQIEGAGPLVVALWDWDFQMWIPIARDPDQVLTTLDRNIARFVGPENAVDVRVTTRDTMAYNRVDYVKITYRGRLINRP